MSFILLKKRNLLLLFFYLPFSYAERVHNVYIQGNKNIDSATIRPHIQLKKGSVYSKKKVQQDIKKIFSLGFFDDIEVHRSYDKKKRLKLFYRFKERAFISKVEFKGNTSLSTKELKEISLIDESAFLDPNELKKTLTAIQKKYQEKAYYNVEVSYKTIKDPDTKKAYQLIIDIKENSKLFIERISFVGNRNIPSQKLKAYMKTKEKSLLSFFGISGTYQPEAIDRDLQVIEFYYRDRGYLNAKAYQPTLSISPDKKFLSLQFKVSEGSRYKMGDVFFEGDDVVSREELGDSFALSKKDYFSLTALQEDIRTLSFLYKNKGYAFVRIEPLFFPDNVEEDKIHISFKVQKGDLYKVRRIELIGNKNSRDKVALRRFRIREGELYNQSRIDLTKRLLEQLTQFESVEISPSLVSSSSSSHKELDLKTFIKERENTGEAKLALGYNSVTKLFVQGGLKKADFLGLDQSVSVTANLSYFDETFVFYYKNPYLFDTQWSFGFDLFNIGQQGYSGSGDFGVSSLFVNDQYRTYFSLDSGFSVSLGRHIGTFSTLFLKYRISNQRLSEESIYYLRSLPFVSSIFGVFDPYQRGALNSPDSANLSQQELLNLSFNDIYELDTASGIKSSLSAILEYDKRNDRFYATAGSLMHLSAEYSGLGGDFDYIKMTGEIRHYYRPFWKLVVKNRLDLGWIFSNDKNKSVPFTELFLLGGPYNLRGFVINSQGPRKYSKQAYQYALAHNQKENSTKIAKPQSFAMRPYGGEQKFFYSLELEIPIMERAGLRAALFVDLGEANKRLAFDLGEQLRANAGFGLRWRSPFGPLNLDWAIPYKPREEYGENDWEFHFSFGSGF